MMNRTKRIVLALMLLAIPLLSALLAYSVFTSTGRAQDGDNSVCPLSDDQARKSVQAFDKIATSSRRSRAASTVMAPSILSAQTPIEHMAAANWISS
jgi:hypothetical protein